MRLISSRPGTSWGDKPGNEANFIKARNELGGGGISLGMRLISSRPGMSWGDKPGNEANFIKARNELGGGG